MSHTPFLTKPRAGACSAILALWLALPTPSSADDWPQWLGPQRDGVWRETGVLKSIPDNKLNVQWRVPVGAGYSGPTVVGSRVFLTDRVADGQDPDSPFTRGAVPSMERVLCLDETNGQIVWKHEYPCTYTVSYPAGPRCSPTFADGRLFTLGAEGHLFAFSADDGKVLWSHDLKQVYGLSQSPVWGFASHPLVDGQHLICLVGGENTAVVAFDVTTGKEAWRALTATGPHGPGYGPPVIYEAAGVRQLIVWLPDAVNALNPESGKVLWSMPCSAREGLTAPMPRKSGNRLFLTAFYDGPTMFELKADTPGAVEVWKGKSRSEKNTDGLHSIMPTPFLEGDHIYGVCSYGQLRCLDAATGKRVWEDLTATGANKARNARWANAFLVKHEDRWFIANERGELVIAKLSPQGYEEISRAPLIAPTGQAGGREIVWSHPAFAHHSVFARNDKELVRASLRAK
jgi:outer membrane protein assembly factor BamB